MIVVDVETTGVDPLKNSIVSIGALDFFNPENQFYEECRIWKGAEINPRALEINGFKEYELYEPNRTSLEKACHKFIDWTKNIKDVTLAGENPRFDRDFLESSFEKYGLHLLNRRTIDLHTLSYQHHLIKGIEIPLKDCCSGLSADETLKYVGLFTEPKPHNALTGAKMEAEAFSRMMYGKGLLKEFEEYKIPEIFKK